MIDIIGALEGTQPSRTKRCKIGRWLDGIPADTAGRADLVDTMECTDPRAVNYRRLDQLDALTSALGFPTSIKTIGDHRANRCRCNR